MFYLHRLMSRISSIYCALAIGALAIGCESRNSAIINASNLGDQALEKHDAGAYAIKHYSEAIRLSPENAEFCISVRGLPGG